MSEEDVDTNTTSERESGLTRRGFLQLSALFTGAMMAERFGVGKAKVDLDRDWEEMTAKYEKIIEYCYPEKGKGVGELAREAKENLAKLGFDIESFESLQNQWKYKETLEEAVVAYRRAVVDIKEGRKDSSDVWNILAENGRYRRVTGYRMFFPPEKKVRRSRWVRREGYEREERTEVKIIHNAESDQLVIGEPKQIEDSQRAYGDFAREVIRFVQDEQSFGFSLPIPGVVVRRKREEEKSVGGFVSETLMSSYETVRILYGPGSFSETIRDNYHFVTREALAHEITHLLVPFSRGWNIDMEMTVVEAWRTYAGVFEIFARKKEVFWQKFGPTIKDYYRKKSEGTKSLYGEVAGWIEANKAFLPSEVVSSMAREVLVSEDKWKERWGDEVLGIGEWFLDQYWNDLSVRRTMGNAFDKRVFFEHFFYHELLALAVGRAVAGDSDFVEMGDVVLSLGRNGVTVERLRAAMEKLEVGTGLNRYKPEEAVAEKTGVAGVEYYPRDVVIVGMACGLSGLIMAGGVAAVSLYEKLRKAEMSDVVLGLEPLSREKLIVGGKFQRRVKDEVWVGRELGRRFSSIDVHPTEATLVIWRNRQEGDSVMVIPPREKAVGIRMLVIGVAGPNLGLRAGSCRWRLRMFRRYPQTIVAQR